MSKRKKIPPMPHVIKRALPPPVPTTQPKPNTQGAGKGYNAHSGQTGIEDETPLLNELRRNERYPFNK